MDAHIAFSVGVNFLLQQISLACQQSGVALGEHWVDNDTLVMHITQPEQAKIYLSPITYNSHPGFKIEKIVAKNIPLGSALIKLVMPWFRKMIEQPIPMAKMEVSGNVIFISNMLSKEFHITNGHLTGDLFIDL